MKTYKVIEYKDCRNCLGRGFNVSSRSDTISPCPMCGGAKITRTEVDLGVAIAEILKDSKISLILGELNGSL